MAKERLGFIGVGRMGDPMARNLLTAGFELTIYDTSAAAIELTSDSRKLETGTTADKQNSGSPLINSSTIAQ